MAASIEIRVNVERRRVALSPGASNEAAVEINLHDDDGMDDQIATKVTREVTAIAGALVQGVAPALGIAGHVQTSTVVVNEAQEQDRIVVSPDAVPQEITFEGETYLLLRTRIDGEGHIFPEYVAAGPTEEKGAPDGS